MMTVVDIIVHVLGQVTLVNQTLVRAKWTLQDCTEHLRISGHLEPVLPVVHNVIGFILEKLL